MIDVLIRIRNEAEWVPQILKSLALQGNVNLGRILFLDHNSTDRPEAYFQRYRNLNIEVEIFDDEYFPGRMLNFGIRKLLEKRRSSEYILIMSAHCFLKNHNDLYRLVTSIRTTDRCRATFGRQVPMSISSPESVRDLALLYTQESRVIRSAAAFNNAFSMIQYQALIEHMFDEEVTNLEDVIWAQAELDLGYVVSYCADAEAVHYHGPHHVNNVRRLRSTHETISKHLDVFRSAPTQPRISPDDVLPVFILDSLKTDFDMLHAVVLYLSEKSKVFVWTDASLPHYSSLKFNSNVVIISRREDSSRFSRPLFSDLPELWLTIQSEGLLPDYVILFDGSYDPNYSFMTVEKAVDQIKKKFYPVIWPVRQNNNFFYRMSSKGEYVLEASVQDLVSEKSKCFEVLRGNGTILSFNYLIKVQDLFQKSDFTVLEKV